MKQPTNGEVAVAMENQTKTPNQPKDSDLFFQKNWTKGRGDYVYKMKHF